jgi:cytochrome P450
VRPQVVLLGSDDVRRVLEGAPDPFSPASREKRAALSHFEPHVSLITSEPERAERRAFNDDVLGSACPVHRQAATFAAVVEEEADQLLRLALPSGELGWSVFFDSWLRIVRRVVLGNGARDDHELTDAIARLRGRANWAFAAPKNRRLRDAFHRRLQLHFDRAEPGSLAAIAARRPSTDATHPTHQMAQWLFAFDPGGMATFRTLSLLVTHPEKLSKVRAEIASPRPAGDLPYLRAAVVEALRLYPTTPMVLRETTQETEWAGGVLPQGSGILIYTPFFHRDDERLPNAHRFEPESWVGKDPGDATPLIPFSAGPAVCPARHLMPMIGSAMLARLLGERREITLHCADRLDPHRPLPGTLDNYTSRFCLPA